LRTVGGRRHWRGNPGCTRFGEGRGETDGDVAMMPSRP
jgi:hypothetical protein